MLFNPIDTLVNMIIRPTRSNYTLKDLGSNWFKYDNKIYLRNDFKIPYLYKKNLTESKAAYQNIQASLFYESKGKIDQTTCVIFLHGNIGSRCTIVPQLQAILKIGCSALCFDFLGCGMSDGDYITLGHEEKHQVNAVVREIEKKHKIKNIILYGRSMGASSALLYYEHYKPKNLLGILVDGPYCNMNKVLEDIGNNEGKWIPNFIIQTLLQKINEQIIKRTGYSLKDIKLQSLTNQVPICILYGEKDQLISVQQINLLIKTLDGDKKLMIFQGEKHNAIREQKQRIQAFNWIISQAKKL